MSFFGNLFRKRPPELNDPVFGCITFSEGIWAHIPKSPCADFMVTVEAPKTGPTDRQRQFFQYIRSRLADFEHRARNFMRSRVDKSVDTATLSIYSVEIGGEDNVERQQFVLELADDDAVVVHCVVFRADEPVDYGFDD